MIPPLHSSKLLMVTHQPCAGPQCGAQFGLNVEFCLHTNERSEPEISKLSKPIVFFEKYSELAVTFSKPFCSHLLILV
jgi:hypothetical protein